MRRKSIITVLIILHVGSAHSETIPDSNHSRNLIYSMDKRQLGESIKKYIMENPEIIRDALGELERRDRENQALLQSKTILEEQHKLISRDGGIIIGNIDGKKSIVEFFDYNCPYCKTSDKILLDMINHDTNVKVVLRMFPIFGKDSIQASKIVLAAARQADRKRLAEFHAELMRYNGRMTGDIALEIAKKQNFDVGRLKIDAEDKSISSDIEENMRLGNRIGVEGTPAFVIGSKIVVGLVDASEIKRQLDGVEK